MFFSSAKYCIVLQRHDDGDDYCFYLFFYLGFMELAREDEHWEQEKVLTCYVNIVLITFARPPN